MPLLFQPVYSTKLLSTNTMDEELAKLRQELKEKSQTIKNLRQRNAELEASASSSSTQKVHSDDFWSDIWFKCIMRQSSEIDPIKSMIKRGELSVSETNRWNETILIIAAQCGAFDLVQFLINNV